LAKRQPKPVTPTEPIWITLRRKRSEVLKKGLREMAAILKIAPTHLSDIETGKRTPSDAVIGRICKHYEISEVALRAGWSRPFSAVATIASQDATTIEKVPALLSAAKTLSPAQWDSLIEAAHRLTGKPKEGPR